MNGIYLVLIETAIEIGLDNMERSRVWLADSVYDFVWAQCEGWSNLDSPNMEPLTGSPHRFLDSLNAHSYDILMYGHTMLFPWFYPHLDLAVLEAEPLYNVKFHKYKNWNHLSSLLCYKSAGVSETAYFKSYSPTFFLNFKSWWHLHIKDNSVGASQKNFQLRQGLDTPICRFLSCRLMVRFWFMCHTWYIGDLPEDHYQADSEKGDMGEVIMIMENIILMIMENIINITCCAIFKMPVHRKDKFTYMSTITKWSMRGGTWGMGDLNMLIENIINNTCGIFFKMPAHREDKFIYVRWALGSSTWSRRTSFSIKLVSEWGCAPC